VPSRECSRAAWRACGCWRDLTSMSAGTGPRSSSACSSSGMRSPRNPLPNHSPASRSRTSLSGTVARSRSMPVVRRSDVSWSRTKAPSRVWRTSNSTASAPWSRASVSAASVFSGAWREAPRCATRAGRECSLGVRGRAGRSSRRSSTSTPRQRRGPQRPNQGRESSSIASRRLRREFEALARC